MTRNDDINDGEYVWGRTKEQQNIRDHGVSFDQAKWAFADPKRVIERDCKHSEQEQRFFCYGHTKEGILTVRFTYRDGKVRIIGAGCWRKGKKTYEDANG